MGIYITAAFFVIGGLYAIYKWLEWRSFNRMLEDTKHMQVWFNANHDFINDVFYYHKLEDMFDTINEQRFWEMTPEQLEDYRCTAVAELASLREQYLRLCQEQ